MTNEGEPDAQPAIRTVAMPADANPSGDIFGGWLLAQMDLAAGMVAYRRAGGRVATVAVDGMSFKRPVHIGDLLSCYAEVSRAGATSLTIRVQSWVRRYGSGATVKVTEGVFTMVAIDAAGKKRPLPRSGDTAEAAAD